MTLETISTDSTRGIRSTALLGSLEDLASGRIGHKRVELNGRVSH